MTKKIIRKFGNWQIEIFENRIRITNGWYSDFPIFYDEYEFALDDPYKLPKSVISYLENNCKKLYDIQDNMHGSNLFRKYRL
jgi:hypothetical protein